MNLWAFQLASHFLSVLQIEELQFTQNDLCLAEDGRKLMLPTAALYWNELKSP